MNRRQALQAPLGVFAALHGLGIEPLRVPKQPAETLMGCMVPHEPLRPSLGPLFMAYLPPGIYC